MTYNPDCECYECCLKRAGLNIHQSHKEPTDKQEEENEEEICEGCAGIRFGCRTCEECGHLVACPDHCKKPKQDEAQDMADLFASHQTGEQLIREEMEKSKQKECSCKKLSCSICSWNATIKQSTQSEKGCSCICHERPVAGDQISYLHCEHCRNFYTKSEEDEFRALLTDGIKWIAEALKPIDNNKATIVMNRMDDIRKKGNVFTVEAGK